MFTLLISNNDLGYQLDIPGKGSPQLKNYLYHTGLCYSCAFFFFLVANWCTKTKSTVSVVIPRQVGEVLQNCRRCQRKQAYLVNNIHSVASSSCLECLDLWWVVTCEINNLSPSSCAWSWCLSQQKAKQDIGHEGNPIKIALRFHLIPVRTAKIKQTKANKYWWLCKKGETHPLLVVVQTGAATMEISMAVPQNTWSGLPIWPSYATSGHVQKGPYILLSRPEIIHVHHCPINNSWDMEPA